MPTIKDVAERAGVTVTTVSRVLNNRGYISNDTRENVHRAMAEINYQPNEVARSLFRKRSKIIGLIIPTIAHPFFAELAGHIEYQAYNYGYKLLLCNSELDQIKEREYLTMLRRHQVDGIIMGSHTLGVNEYLNLSMPIITFDRIIDVHVPYVSSDNFRGGFIATKLLVDKGCKKIAHISGNLSLNLLANKRHEAFIQVANQHHIEHVEVQTEINALNTNEYEQVIYNLFENHPDLDGVFCSSDLIAAHLIAICRRLRKRIPEEIRIVGYDGIYLAALTFPQLTTIKQPIEKMGKLAVKLIVKQLNGEEVPMGNIIPVELVKGETT